MAASAQLQAFDQHEHDHAACVAQALAEAQSVCQRAGTRLTATRRQVLELIWAAGKPVGAYEVLETMSAQAGKRVAPPTVYRALEFLVQQGLVHRLASLNAYVGCRRPHARHAGHFLICRQCSAVAELADQGIDAVLKANARRLGFTLEAQTVELAGLCPACAEAGDGG